MTLNYDPKGLPRELKQYYISASDQEIKEMLETIGLNDLSELFHHINDDVKFDYTPKVCPEFEYDNLVKHFEEIAKKNNNKTSFLGDALKHYEVSPVVPKVCDIRGLTTAYTPYQPERSQGTLTTLWLYSSGISALTGFEAINASFYERSTCLYEALNTGIRLKRGKNKVIVTEANYPQDLEVLDTLAAQTNVEIIRCPLDSKTGQTDVSKLKAIIEEHKDGLAAFAYPQVNCLGNLEDVHLLNDLAHDNGLKTIALVDPFILNSKGLAAPVDFGQNGADMIVGEGQALCLGPNFGGPGLGIFGIRYTDKNKNDIRQTAGRFVGAAKDMNGRECRAMILSTREQHIRREKATSNICSNQSFVATIAGAALVNKGDAGLASQTEKSMNATAKAVEVLTSYEGIELAYPEATQFNEVTFRINASVKKMIQNAAQEGLHLGVNVSDRANEDDSLLMMFFNDQITDQDISKLDAFLGKSFKKTESSQKLQPLHDKFQRNGSVNLPALSEDKVVEYYQQLGDQNVSPDDAIYPLGSCTMKYNPYINDYTASLEGFTASHPQAPTEDVQGSLQVIYEIQEYFKDITGLPGVVTQPVAGAQGELVGLKMFQAYHEKNNEVRDVVLIPRSAHGTNPATATMAGFETKMVDGLKVGIVLIEALDNGLIDMDNLKANIEKYGKRISGIMVTNPNTSGVFETSFKEMAELIHDVGGLVYMDGANMNAIAGWVDLNKMGVDAVHNNLHKTWTIPHGGGGPGDAIVAVSEKLIPFMPGVQIRKNGDQYETFTTDDSIGSFHRHFGNFAHKVRALTYIKRLGSEGIRKMSAVSVLASRYLHEKLKGTYPTLPISDECQKMHEFIVTLSDETFEKVVAAGLKKSDVIARVGKLFLDFGMHAPTVAFPEVYGLMIEPTESFTKAELDRFVDVVLAIHEIINENPEVLLTAPHFTPIDRVDEVGANKTPVMAQAITEDLPTIIPNRVHPKELGEMPIAKIKELILKAHNDRK